MLLRICIAPFVLVALCLLCGCSVLGSGRDVAAGIGQENGFEPVSFYTGLFTLQGWIKTDGRGPEMHVYIEGDGRAWKSRRAPSDDPTPQRPVAFELAAVDPASTVLYLARPCQYVCGEDRRNCETGWWTGARFHEDVIRSVNEAIDQAKAMTKVEKTVLVGYSGGGAVALLCAAKRQDVVQVYTVAGNLDHRVWTEVHGVSPLRASLNPPDFADAMQNIPQLHVVGENDGIVPFAVTESYLSKVYKADGRINQRICRVENAHHDFNWSVVWQDVLSSKDKSDYCVHWK